MKNRTMDWTLARFNNLGEEVDVEYEVEYDVTPGEEAYTSGPPEKCYPGSPPEFEIIDIWLCNDGYGRRVKLDPKNWEWAGFTAKEVERMEEAAYEKAAEYDEPDPPEPMDRD